MSGLFRALHRTKVFRNLTEQEFAWVLYDVGNSAFIMLACSLIPIWFKSLAIGTGPGKISSDQATAYYSIAISIVTVVVALIGPVCGVLAGGTINVAVACLAVFFALGFVFLKIADHQPMAGEK